MSGPTKDLVIVGSGAAGLTAAITAAALGRSVLVVEKAERVGGTTAWSGGAAWLPLNPHMAAAGVTDTRADAEAYIRAVVGQYYDMRMVAAFLDNTAEMVSFLETHSSAVRFQSFASPDYHPDLPGAMPKARSLIPLPYDGRGLGEWLTRLRLPLPQLTVLRGMQVDALEAQHLQSSWKSWKSFKISACLVGRYVADRTRFGRGTRMIRGTALAARLLRSALDRGVEIWTGARAIELLRRGGRVSGLVVNRGGLPVSVEASRGVILASGGFSANRDLMARHIPFASTHISVLPDTNVGDGIAMAEALGATLGPPNAANAIWAPGSARRTPAGRIVPYPHFAFDRCKPGSMIVGPDGNRFANEAQSYHVLVNIMHARGAVPAWLIADHTCLRRYGLGLARPAPYPYRHLVREGYLIEGRTLAELAARIGVSAAALEVSVRRMNGFAATGVDEDFGKGGDIYTRSLGDARNRPNPCLGPIIRPPFYALALYGTDAGTTLGLSVDPSAQVLGPDGHPLVGLYAVGLDMNSVMRGFYPGAGTMIGPAMTFAYIAARHAARAAGIAEPLRLVSQAVPRLAAQER